MNSSWHESRFTGIFREFQRVPPRPHDPPVSIFAGVATHWHPDQNGQLDAGGCGWSDDAATAACVGESIERLFAYPAKQDAVVESSYEKWPLDEPAVAPERWVLFNPQQYAQAHFPFQPLTRQTNCRWVCFRDVSNGEPQWVLEEFAYLLPRPGGTHHFGPATSTGLAAGTAGQPIVLRALQEVIERDALMGAWWGTYPVEEFCQEDAWTDDESVHLQRPNLRWRFFKIQSPFSHHVTMVTVEGEDREGYCHSIGSACRESRRTSWSKATLEAIQGRHYVRYLRARDVNQILKPPLETFASHALYYSLHPKELATTALHRARSPSDKTIAPDENLDTLRERLGESYPVLFRNLTPPMLAGKEPGWRVVKVVVPGLQPMHADDRFAHLGGPLWSPRKLNQWNEIPPHPFP